jgi:two-component SAPR family response regulator
MFVTQSTVARWENGSRLPDAEMIARLSDCLSVDVSVLLNPPEEDREATNVILVDDRKIILTGALPVLREVFPNARVTGFTRPSEVIRFAQEHPISLAFLDIELGKTNGLALCRSLLDIRAQTNVVYLTAYAEYSFDAWSTGACGFMLKPITPEGVRAQLKTLRYPIVV